MKKQILIASIFQFAFFFIGYSQNIKKDLSDLDSLIYEPKVIKKPDIMTYKNLNKLLYKNQYQIGGAGLKDGRSFTNNAVIDEKSLTLNSSFKPSKYMLFIQPRFAMTGADNFVSIFSNDKFNKIYSFGINFVGFWHSSIKADSMYILLVHNNLRFQKAKYELIMEKQKMKKKNMKKEYSNLINETINLFDRNKGNDSTVYKFYNHSIIDYKKKGTQIKIDSIEKAKENLSKLIELKIIDEKVLSDGSDEIIKIISALKKDSDYYYNKIAEILTKHYIDVTDSIQLNMKISKSILWFSGGANYNLQKQPVLLDISLTSPVTYNNEFWTQNFAFTYQKLSEKWNFSASGQLTHSNSRNFNNNNKQTVNFQSPIVLHGYTAQNIDSTISFFNRIPSVLNTWNIEVPLTLFNKNKEFGFDLSFRYGMNNLNNDNMALRFGIILPVGKKDDKVILVEPMFKFMKLNSISPNDFWKDNFLFGINLSVNLNSVNVN